MDDQKWEIWYRVREGVSSRLPDAHEWKSFQYLGHYKERRVKAIITRLNNSGYGSTFEFEKREVV